MPEYYIVQQLGLNMSAPPHLFQGGQTKQHYLEYLKYTSLRFVNYSFLRVPMKRAIVLGFFLKNNIKTWWH